MTVAECFYHLKDEDVDDGIGDELADEPGPSLEGPSLEVPGADSSVGDHGKSAESSDSHSTKPDTVECNGSQSLQHTDIPLDSQVSSDSGAKIESPSGKRLSKQ